MDDAKDRLKPHKLKGAKVYSLLLKIVSCKTCRKHCEPIHAHILALQEEKNDLLDCIIACLVAAGAPDPESCGLDAMIKDVNSKSTKPSEYIKNAIVERDNEISKLKQLEENK